MVDLERVNRLDVKMTLDEYLYELQNRDEVLRQQPDLQNIDDPLYMRKFAHCMPPLLAYRCKPLGHDKVNVQGDDNRRMVYYGWNNLTEYEKNGIERVVDWLQKEKQQAVPEGFGERNLLKFVQANFFAIDKAGERLFNHFKWLDSIPREPRLTKNTIKLLQSGCFYILGRDKYFRPCLVLDCAVMAKLNKSDPSLLATENFNAEFVFLFQYLRYVMFLPGHID
jgi:hypothetical protein